MELKDLPAKYQAQAKKKYEQALGIKLKSKEKKDFEEKMDSLNPVPSGAYRIYVMGKPRGKERPRFNSKTGVAYTPKSTHNYEYSITEAWKKKYPTHIPFECPLRVKMLAAFEPPKGTSKKKLNELIGKPYPKKPDADNICKEIDALNNVVWKDDNQVAELICKKIYDTKSYLMIEVSKL